MATPRARRTLPWGLLSGLVAGLLAVALGFSVVDDPLAPARAIVALFAPKATVPEVAGADAPEPLRGPDGTLTTIALVPVAKGFSQPTDVQFPPGESAHAIVLEKEGRGHVLSLPEGTHRELLRVEVLTMSEEGLLGLAFHPQFTRNGRFFLNYVRESGKRHVTRVAEWTLSPPGDLAGGKAREVKTLLEVEQPFPNHNAGQLAFGPDGLLYIGLGDGGMRDDPYGHGQNLGTLLGSMLRIDVDRADEGRAYAIPKDNPFVGRKGARPEIWAYGLRNPWRYSFDPAGRLIVADVGQDRWEEVSIVQAGDNLGWDIREGFACSDGKATRCGDASMVDPIHVYGRERGASITGGYVVLGKSAPSLTGKYVFGDYVSGRLFAMTLPKDRKQKTEATLLGRFAIAPSTFARDAAGELYVADFAKGTILRVTAGKP